MRRFRRRDLWSETVTKERRYFSADQKVAMLRRHLIEKLPVSKICEEAGVAPNLFYRWQDQLFQNGAMALESTSGRARRTSGASASPHMAGTRTQLVTVPSRVTSDL